MKPLFSVSNHQCEDSGSPPKLPDDFDSGPYFRSYFENALGEQWLFWRDRRTGEIRLRGGDCGWPTRLRPARVRLGELLAAARRIGDRSEQFLLADVTPVPVPILISAAQIRETGTPAEMEVTLVLDGQGALYNVSDEERIWIDACLAASRDPAPRLTPEELDALVARWRSRDAAAEEE